MNVCAEHSFPEEAEPGGRHILAPCLVCGLKPADFLAAMNRALARARDALERAGARSQDAVGLHQIIAGGLYDVSKIIRSMDVVID